MKYSLISESVSPFNMFFLLYAIANKGSIEDDVLPIIEMVPVGAILERVAFRKGS